MAFTALTRFTFTVSAGLGLAIGLASCVDGSLDTPGGSAGTIGAGAVPGAGAAAGSNGVGAGTSMGGANATGSGATSGTGMGGANTAGTSSGANGGMAGSVNNGGMAGTGTGGSPPVCTNVPAPSDDPSWEGTCEQWANETEECNAQWFVDGGYCNESCGRCKSSGTGGTGNGGSGNGGSGNNGSGGTNPGPNLPDITSGEVYFATRYWDCCKTHCATNAGAQSCGQDGVSQNGGGSSCTGGSAYACYSEAPRAVGTQVSYGYVAVPNPQCNKCYHLQFTGSGQYNAADPGSQRIAGKHMIVKVSNTGHDVASKQFDLMIPGGGVGVNQGACKNQWGNIDLGATYGGFLSYDDNICYSGNIDQRQECVRAKCNTLPAGDARDGCLWWVDWLELADNPQFRYTEINCPNDI